MSKFTEGNTAGKQFSSEYQPKNRQKGKTLTTLLKERLEGGENYAVFEKAEVLDSEGYPTGQTVKVRVKLMNKEMLINAALSRAMKKSDKMLIHLWDRLEGRVKYEVEQTNKFDMSEDEEQEIINDLIIRRDNRKAMFEDDE